MKRELDEKLCKDFPNLYENRYADMRTTAMVWGFDCGDGWFDLIYKLSKDITDFENANPDKFKDFHTVASQVKEKYGTLRFYVEGTTDEIWDMIEEAEHKSEFICEQCGVDNPSGLKDEGWIYNMCDKCYVEFQLKRNK